MDGNGSVHCSVTYVDKTYERGSEVYFARISKNAASARASFRCMQTAPQVSTACCKEGNNLSRWLINDKSFCLLPRDLCLPLWSNKCQNPKSRSSAIPSIAPLTAAIFLQTIWNAVSSSRKYLLIGCGWQWQRFHSLAYPDGELGGSNPPLNLQKFFNCEFAKYTPTVQALLLYSLNPKFSTGIR